MCMMLYRSREGSTRVVTCVFVCAHRQKTAWTGSMFNKERCVRTLYTLAYLHDVVQHAHTQPISSTSYCIPSPSETRHPLSRRTVCRNRREAKQDRCCNRRWVPSRTHCLKARKLAQSIQEIRTLQSNQGESDMCATAPRIEKIYF